jgi:hypothetical protein
MAAVWVRSNRRALVWGMIVPATLALIGLAVAAWMLAAANGQPNYWLLIPAVLVGVGVLGLLALVREMLRPRLSYADGHLRVHLGNGPPEKVPIEFVECFFRGQGSSMVKDHSGHEPEVATVIVRIAERAADYKHRDVKAALGHWCEGYITLRGTWCEPIDNDGLLALNRRLVAAQREQKQNQVTSESRPGSTEAVGSST